MFTTLSLNLSAETKKKVWYVKAIDWICVKVKPFLLVLKSAETQVPKNVRQCCPLLSWKVIRGIIKTKSSCVLDGGVQAYISSPAEESVALEAKFNHVEWPKMKMTYESVKPPSSGGIILLSETRNLSASRRPKEYLRVDVYFGLNLQLVTANIFGIPACPWLSTCGFRLS